MPKKQLTKKILLAGLALITGLPFLAAGISATLLSGKLNKGLPISAVILFLSWYLTGFQGAAVTAAGAAMISISARSGYSLLKTLYLTVGATLLVGGLLVPLGFPGMMNIGETELTPLREVYISAGLDNETIDTVFSLITYYSPGIGAAHIVLGSIVSVLFFRAFTGKNTNSKIHGTAKFRMHWGFAWVPIICLMYLVTARSFPVSPLILRIAKNLLIFCSLPYGIEGFQVAIKWAKNAQGMIFILIMTAVFAPPFFLSVLILLGILDTWFDYRKKIDIRIERIKNEGSSDQNS